MKDNQERDPEKDPKTEADKEKDQRKLAIGLVVGLTVVLMMFMIFGISRINIDKDIQKADLLVEEENYRGAIDIYDRVLSRKNSPEVKKKREIALELLDPKDKTKEEAKEEEKASKEDKPEKDTADKGKEDKPAEDKDEKAEEENKEAEEDPEEIEEEPEETEEEPEETEEEPEETEEDDKDDKGESQTITAEESDLPSKTVWAARANIRSGPSESSGVVGVITKNTAVYIEDEKVESSRRTWYKIIATVNGQRIEGWMASNTLNN